MNKNLLFLLIITFILITFIIIFFILFNNRKIEQFDVEELPPVNFPPAVNNGDIVIIYTTSPELKVESENTEVFNNRGNNNNGGINIREKYDITDPASTTDNSINGYGTYYVASSFYIIDRSTTTNNCLSRLLIPSNNNRIFLITPNFYKTSNIKNWISIKYPEKFQFKKIEIIAISNIGNIKGTPIENITLENISIRVYNNLNNTYYKINTLNQIGLNGKFVLSVSSPVVIDNFFIVFTESIKAIILTNIEIFGYAINSSTVATVSDSTEVSVDNDIGVFTSNPNSKFQEINTTSSIDEAQEEKANYIEGGSIIDKFKAVLANNLLPWGIYSAQGYSANILPDIYNRACRSAIVTGDCQLRTEPIEGTTRQLTYLQGTKDTRIMFPTGSLPRDYTICIISKYTNPNANRGRILTSDLSNNPNWLLGHYSSRATGAMYNGSVVYSDTKLDTTTNWRVSCAKSRAKNPLFSVIINDTAVAIRIAGPNTVYADARLVINGTGYQNELSDFGFAYLIIWDYALSDNELLVVSQTLTNYITTGEPIPLNQEMITNSLTSGTIGYGKSKERPGFSAEDIKNVTCTNEDGLYWIKNPANNSVKQIYCIMNSSFNNGNTGWMLAMKGDNRNTIFSYDANYWTADNVYNEFDVDTTFATSAKYDIFNYYRVKDSIAIFDSNDTGRANCPYGWLWAAGRNFGMSLREYFNAGKSYFAYTSVNNYDLTIENNYRQYYDNRLSDTTVIRLSKNAFTELFINNVYDKTIWSRQEEFQSFGFNITIKYWKHKVRWGGVFNENDGAPGSCDVSGGIGLSSNSWGAGNSPICCQSSPSLAAKQMAFKWFIK